MQSTIVAPVQIAAGNFNVYDIRKECIGPLCYGAYPQVTACRLGLMLALRNYMPRRARQLAVSAAGSICLCCFCYSITVVVLETISGEGPDCERNERAMSKGISISPVGAPVMLAEDSKHPEPRQAL